MINQLFAKLDAVINLLKKQGICKDRNPYDAAKSTFHNKRVFAVQRLKLDFDASIQRNCHPALADLSVIYSVSIRDFDKVNEMDLSLPIADYNFSLEIIGHDNNGALHHISWHLDYDNSGSATIIHPYSHLTLGGNLIKNDDLGDLMILPTPRLFFPPMDFMTGIDFILSNFILKKDYDQIRANSMYKSALKQSQDWLWKPYYLSIANYWCKNLGYTIPENQEKAYVPNLL